MEPERPKELALFVLKLEERPMLPDAAEREVDALPKEWNAPLELTLPRAAEEDPLKLCAEKLDEAEPVAPKECHWPSATP